MIIESFGVKFYAFYVQKTAPFNETKFILQNGIPTHSAPLNIVEVNYGTIFDPPETTRLIEIQVSPVPQLQHSEVSGPSFYDDSSLNTSTSPVEGKAQILHLSKPSRF